MEGLLADVEGSADGAAVHGGTGGSECASDALTNAASGSGHDGDIVPAPAEGCTCAAIEAAIRTNESEEGSLSATTQELNAERNGGDGADLYELVDAKGKKGAQSGGTISIKAEEDAPALQLLSAEVSDPNVKVTLTSTGVDYNKPATWQAEGFGEFCWKLEPFGDSDYRYLLPDPSQPPNAAYAGRPYSAVIVKAGSLRESDPAYQVNTVFMNPQGDTEVFADVNRNGKIGRAHV